MTFFRRRPFGGRTVGELIFAYGGVAAALALIVLAVAFAATR